ncbi:MAG: ABC transporter ATP-binding protein [Christensenellales bacterium]
MLKITNLHKTFNKGLITEKKAIAGIDLTVADGDFITVIGGNGAGKSTLLNLLSGVYPADCGSIVLDGENITNLPEYKRAKYFGRVFQDPMIGTSAAMEIQENLALAYRRGKRRTLRWEITKAEKELFYRELKQLGLGLEERLSAKAGLLSGGQRQALTLLMATLQKPKMLLLDEHTAALDPKTAIKVQQLTKQITEENNLTTLMITHNMKDAIKYGNRLIMMHNGKIIFQVEGEEKSNITVAELLAKFEESVGDNIASDRMLLA